MCLGADGTGCNLCPLYTRKNLYTIAGCRSGVGGLSCNGLETQHSGSHTPRQSACWLVWMSALPWPLDVVLGLRRQVCHMGLFLSLPLASYPRARLRRLLPCPPCRCYASFVCRRLGLLSPRFSGRLCAARALLCPDSRGVAHSGCPALRSPTFTSACRPVRRWPVYPPLSRGRSGGGRAASSLRR